ncbi:MAG: hypothetical protein IJF01_07350 [Tidjanibacter sp.]|nr:hypothetical protein [Tidjanibacter sp.]
MREIKFRGKTKNGEWLYGDLLQVANEVFIAPSDGDWFDFIPWSGNNVFHLPAAKYVVIPDTVGQFTGLYDKNGKEIYFDDIVRDKYGDIGSVIWFSDWSIRVDWGGGDIHFIDPEWGLEVIGNIHDNPEMLN